MVRKEDTARLRINEIKILEVVREECPAGRCRNLGKTQEESIVERESGQMIQALQLSPLGGQLPQGSGWAGHLGIGLIF